MEIRHALRLAPEDHAQPRDLVHARNLVCAHDLPEDDDKAFRVIGANDFTVRDVERAVAAIRAKAAYLRQFVKTEVVLADPKEKALYVEAVLSNCDHAERLAQRFLDELRMDFSQMAS